MCFPDGKDLFPKNSLPPSLQENFREWEFGDDHFSRFVIGYQDYGKDLHP